MLSLPPWTNFLPLIRVADVGMNLVLKNLTRQNSALQLQLQPRLRQTVSPLSLPQTPLQPSGRG
jgi:hypothetical protein